MASLKGCDPFTAGSDEEIEVPIPDYAPPNPHPKSADADTNATHAAPSAYHPDRPRRESRFSQQHTQHKSKHGQYSSQNHDFQHRKVGHNIQQPHRSPHSRHQPQPSARPHDLWAPPPMRPPPPPRQQHYQPPRAPFRHAPHTDHLQPGLHLRNQHYGPGHPSHQHYHHDYAGYGWGHNSEPNWLSPTVRTREKLPPPPPESRPQASWR